MAYILTKGFSVRDRLIVGTDKKTGGLGQFLVGDLISVTKAKHVFVVDGGIENFSWKSGGALAMKNMADNNGNGKMYGFVTSGKLWQLIEYNGASFWITNRCIYVVFCSRRKKKSDG